MNVIRVSLIDINKTNFDLGYVGEKNHTKVVINCASIFRDYPDAVATMVAKPPQGDLYPINLTKDGTTITWEITESDIAYAGSGQYQLTFTDGTGDDAEIIKTVYGQYSIKPSLTSTGEPPEPLEDWLQEATAALETFETEIGEVNKITTASPSDVGKALSPKTVVSGKVTAWEYVNPADPEAIAEAVDEWLDDHPEATTTVEDGAITEPKLNDSLKADLAWQDDLDDVKNAINQSKAPVILDTASGEIVTVPDGADGMLVEKLTVEIEPVQDLHGQENPYPAGGGKNLFDRSLMSDAESGTKYIELSLKPNTAYTASSNDPMTSGAADIFFLLPDESVSTGTNGVYNNRPVTKTTGADGIARIGYRVYNDLPVATLIGFETQVEEGSTASPFAPYSNICPISGWTGANVARTGENLCYKVLSNAISLYPQDNNRSVVLASAGTSACFKCVKGQTYTVSGATGRNRNMVSYYDTYPVVGSVSVAPNTAILYPASDGFTFTAEYTGYAACYLANSILSDVNIQVELGSTASQYETYHGSSTSYPFPSQAGTVYGGTLTVNKDGTGTLTLDRIGKVFRGTDVYTTVSNTAIVSFGMSDKLRSSYTASGELQAKMINSHFKLDTGHGGWGVIEENSFIIAGDYFWGTPFTGTTAEYQTYLEAQYSAGTPVSCIAVLQTPITYNLTNLDVVTLLKGNNNLWADCGDTTIEYPCDTKLYIDKKFVELQALILEN